MCAMAGTIRAHIHACTHASSNTQVHSTQAHNTQTGGDITGDTFSYEGPPNKQLQQQWPNATKKTSVRTFSEEIIYFLPNRGEGGRAGRCGSQCAEPIGRRRIRPYNDDIDTLHIYILLYLICGKHRYERAECSEICRYVASFSCLLMLQQWALAVGRGAACLPPSTNLPLPRPRWLVRKSLMAPPELLLPRNAAKFRAMEPPRSLFDGNE